MSLEELKAVQYVRENLDLFHNLGIDTNKLKVLLNLIDRLGKQNEEFKQELYEKLPNNSAIEELLQGCYDYLGNDYVSKDKIEKIIKKIDKQRSEFINKFVCGDPKETLLFGGVYEKALIEMFKIQQMLADVLKEGQYDNTCD